MNVTKKITVAIMTILCVVFAAFAVSCTGGQVEISFETDDVVAVESVKVDKDKEYTLPTASATGYEFLGWYENADYTGNAVTTVKPTANVKYYAKWEKLAKITLDLDGGSASAGDVYVKVGSSLLDGLKGVTPTKSGFEFGRWLLDDKEVTSSTKAADGQTVKADYKVGYTIEVYLEKLDGTGYEKKAENVKGYDYIQKNYAPSYTETGFVKTTNADEVVKKDLTANASENVYKIYFNRKTIEITYRPEYPDGSEGSDITDTLKYGQTKYVEAKNVKCNGYVLIGWATEKGGEVKYATNFFDLDGVVFNHDGEVKEPAQLEIDSDLILYGVWVEGYTNMFGGDDVVYRLSSDESVVYIERGGKFFKGNVLSDGSRFSFRTEKTTYSGKIVGNMYVYQDLDRDNSIFYQYDRRLSNSIDKNVSLIFNAYNGLTYSVTEKDGKVTVKGKGDYVIVEDEEFGMEYYVATFTEGEMVGETLTFITGEAATSDGDLPVFTARSEEEYAYGSIVRFAFASDTEIGYFRNGYYEVKLNGFSTAIYNNVNSTTGEIEKITYTYVVDGEYINLSTSAGRSAGMLKILEKDIGGTTVKGYAVLNTSYLHDYVSGDKKLSLDGTFNATFDDGTTVMEGLYRVTGESVLGGNIAVFVDSATNNVYTFRLTSTTIETDGDRKTSYIFEQKAKDYAEYRYSNENGKYKLPLLVVNDTAVGEATLYAYTKTGLYVVASTGTYTVTEDRILYEAAKYYTIEEEIFTENVPDVKDIKSFVAHEQDGFLYFDSYVKKNNDIEDLTGRKKEYTSGTAKVVVYGGFFFYTSGSDTTVGTYKLNTTYGLYVVTFDDEEAYFELDDTAETFIKLDYAPYRAYAYSETGETNAKEYLMFDGKGGATYIIEAENSTTEKTAYELNLAGRVAAAGYKSDVSNVDVQQFTATTGNTKFDFILLYSSSVAYFSKYNGETDGRNDYLGDDGVLTLDGFGYRAEYTDAAGKKLDGSYLFIEANVVRLTITNDDGTRTYRYFDISGETFTIRGLEYGNRVYMDNQNAENLYFEFDGYSKVRVYTREPDLDEQGNQQVDEDGYIIYKDVNIDVNGSYVKNSDGNIVITYKKSAAETVTITGKLSIYTTTAGSYLTFVKLYDKVALTFVNPEDFTVITFDDAGNAVKYLTTGVKQTGKYVIVSDELVYYVNDDATDACTYYYDVENATIEATKLYDISFYTDKLESLRFSEHGFAIFNGDTRYYYEIDEEGNYIVYRVAKDNETPNAYGYFKELFCKADELDDIKENGTAKTYGGKTYHYADGWNIEFNRVEENKEKYPVLVSQSIGKKPFERLSFTPGGGMEFTVRGTVVIGGNTYNCYVTRAEIEDEEGKGTGEYETYLTIGYYRVDIDLSYLGVDKNYNSLSKYDVTGLSYAYRYFAYNYLDFYYTVYTWFGASVAASMPNTYGTLTNKIVYDEKGDTVSDSFTAILGESAALYDLNGNMFTGFTDADYAVNATTGTRYVEMEGTDGYTYRLHFAYQGHSAFGLYGYVIVALTRVQTFTYEGGYVAEVEKIIASDYSQNYVPGSVFIITLKNGETAISFSEIANVEGSYYGIYRERNEETKLVTKTVYYKFGFVDADNAYMSKDRNDNDIVLSPASYTSVTMQIIEMKTVYNKDVNRFVDFNEADNTIFLFYSNDDTGEVMYLITEQTYDETNKTYTITAGGKQYTVKFNDDGTAEIARANS